ncbi:hypothetical protein [Glycomyces algeriensis]|uniref:Uncharacterized protein n=1 Tax=Glycomyces algeriensis TaxID=256037 RepID=A0A9W6LI40_9ACTN|nr:hypothetical protein [Glycomyces algeriensis]MDA1364748.1 hypothetical protein [Glycomyces algeriensis]MDR7350789.1 hypothetical protein [Glycomyces algeriensis]GLI43499.1 hypothetical protein GALLR39Z86_33490 [Glycomyces algeriensis]
MEPHPLVREVYPELVAEVARLLEVEGERHLAIAVHDLRLIAECGCKEDFCQSFRTAEHPPGTPYGPGHRNVVLAPETGDLVLDVVHERIVYVEVLDRPSMTRRDA